MGKKDSFGDNRPSPKAMGSINELRTTEKTEFAVMTNDSEPEREIWK